MSIKMNWGVGYYHNAIAKPTDDITIHLLEYRQGSYTHFDVHVTDVAGNKKHYKRIRYGGISVNLTEGRKRARVWLETHMPAIRDFQADVPPPVDKIALLNEKITLNEKINKAQGLYDRTMDQYRKDYKDAADGKRTKFVNTGQTRKVKKSYPYQKKVWCGWSKEYYSETHYQSFEEDEAVFKEVPNYPEEPKYPQQLRDLKVRLTEIDELLK